VDAESLNKTLEPRESSLVSLKENLVDVVWAHERPARPKSKVFPLDVKYSGNRFNLWVDCNLTFSPLRSIIQGQNLQASGGDHGEEGKGDCGQYA
jgi:hypothetical protein